MGGTIGTLLAGVFATTAANPNLGVAHLASYLGHTLWIEQAKAGLLTIAWSVSATVLLAKLVGWITGGLRVSQEDETAGLDVVEHGEEGYILD